MKTILILGCVLLLSGCSSVLMQDALPEATLTEEEQSELTGSWRLDELVVHIAFTTNNVPWLAMIDWDEDNFQLKKHRLYYSKRNDSLFISMPSEPNGKSAPYFFAEIKINGKDLLVWVPDVDQFTALIEQEKLKGVLNTEKHSKEILLEDAPQTILEVISSDPRPFDYKEPLLFKKLD